MTPQRYQLVKHIFLDVCRSEPTGRLALLDSACGGDAELRTEVQSLLDQDARCNRFLEKPALDASTILGRPRAGNGLPHQPERIGQYRIIDVLGMGGMGVVYLAEQENPRRPVALKIIRPGIASEEMIRRFEYEAQILGRLHHPGIGQVYEAGIADTGFGPQPFFAMELIDGSSLLEYVSQRKLSLRERLELLIKICEAVHHAHQKGVIHRDLKPGNILVVDEDQGAGAGHDASGVSIASKSSSSGSGGSGVRSALPKILDFGVARAIDADPSRTLSTSAGQLIGTIAYMSPEQVAADPHDLDTRADVYSLGAIYYELLSGSLPHNIEGKSLPECARIIKESPIAPLGLRDKAFRGDLETIVGKALEKDRARRYQSALALAEDTRRFLTDQPIAARPPSKMYLARKFARRNKAMVAMILLLVVVLGIATSALAWSKAMRRAKAQTVAMYVRTLTRDLDVAEGADPIKPQAHAIAELEDYARFAHDDLGSQPLLAANLWDLIGLNYLKYEIYDDARRFVQMSLDTRRKALPAINADVAQSLHDLGRVLWATGDYSRAEESYREALNIRLKLPGDQRKDISMSLMHIAACRRDQNDFAQAEQLYSEALQMRREKYGESHPDVAASYNNLATCYEKQSRYADAAGQFLKAIGIIEKLYGPADLRIARGKRHIASCWIELKQYDDAEAFLDDALQAQRRFLGAENRDVAATLHELARLRFAQERFEEAEELCRHALGMRQAKLSPQHAEVIQSLQLLQDIEQKKRESSSP